MKILTYRECLARISALSLVKITLLMFHDNPVGWVPSGYWPHFALKIWAWSKCLPTRHQPAGKPRVPGLNAFHWVSAHFPSYCVIFGQFIPLESP